MNLEKSIIALVASAIHDDRDGVTIYETEPEAYNGRPAVRFVGEDDNGDEFEGYLVIETVEYH